MYKIRYQRVCEVFPFNNNHLDKRLYGSSAQASEAIGGPITDVNHVNLRSGSTCILSYPAETTLIRTDIYIYIYKRVRISTRTVHYTVV